MTIPSNLGTIHDILDNKILTAQELEKSFAGVPGPVATDEAAVEILSRDGALTPFQAQAVREGRAAELQMGNYIVLDKLGAGGMGAVYKARDRRMKRMAALKVLKKELVGSPDSVARFNREVEASAQVAHPGVIAVYYTDEGPMGHYLAMEFVEGTDLAGLVMKRGPLPIAEAVETIRQAAVAMAYVHSKGLVHRDIKPANFLIDKSGTVKVADLGLVRITEQSEISADADQESLTQAYTIAGTLEFMAPEQAMDTKSADHRADIYSLGCTLWYLLTGRNVYQAKTQMQKILAHQKEPIPSLCQARPDAPPALDAIFRKMVEKEISKRYQSMDEVASDLSKLKLSAPAATVAAEENGATMVVQGGMAALAESAEIASPETLVAGQSVSTVIVVDSSDFFLKRMASQAESLGKQFQVVKAKNIMQAREALHDHPGVCLVLASKTLADGSGVELLQEMRQEDSTRGIMFGLVTSDDDGASAVAGIDRAMAIKKNSFAADLAELAGKIQQGGGPSKPVADMAALIADDSHFARKRIEKALRAMGFANITVAKDGAEAVEKIEASAFDMIVTDFNMPNLTGEAVTRKVRLDTRNSKTPVLMFTSETEDHILQSAWQAGVDKILPKNATEEDVQSSVRQLLGLR